MNFEGILGNFEIRKELQDMVLNNAVSHSYLFKGTEGIGKKIIAKDFAKMILCLNENKYCNQCDSCIKFDTENNPDFKIIESNGNSIKIEQIRQMLEEVYIKPIISNKKVFIIDDADKMTDGAQNALLKTLEEPPEYIVIILITSNENKILNTIKSRCLTISFKNLDKKDIDEYIKKINIKDKFTKNILAMCNGSIGKLIEVNENIVAYENVEKNIVELLKGKYKNQLELINKFDFLYESKEIIINLLDFITVILFNYIRETNEYRKNFLKIISIIEDIKNKITMNVNYDMCIDNLLLKIWEEING